MRFGVPERVVPACVMIVDDESDIRELLRELLERRGYSVCTAANGREALAALHEPNRICFVLTDLMMPEVDGLGLLESMAADPKLCDVPVCMSTSTPVGVPVNVACLPKPINLQKLYELIDRYCVS